MPHASVLLLPSRGPDQVEILGRPDQHGELHSPFWMVKFLKVNFLQFSMCQLGAAITVAVQAKHATLLTRVLGTEVSLITIGVSASLPEDTYFAPRLTVSLPFHLS